MSHRPVKRLYYAGLSELNSNPLGSATDFVLPHDRGSYSTTYKSWYKRICQNYYIFQFKHSGFNKKRSRDW